MKRILLAIVIPAALLLSSCSSSDSAEAKSTGAGEFSSCADAKAAGAAPLLKGDPGYRAEWDRDGDGVACETDSVAKVTTPVAAAPETQDSGMYGILVPATANNRKQLSENKVSFDLPGMDLHEASKWMGSHLPAKSEVSGMQPCGLEKFDDMQEWTWRGEKTASGAELLSVSVLITTPTSVLIKYSPADANGGC
ncbi:excalibur calcium-binding domain-containing protein [Rhodococcus globerulus]|uniref:Excalibur calcium-binding domain-containing protein n=1 Tax=Rhodococcus globerulus TaxID=33008 RepID=A0ABU4BSA4_RHOGO|nr:excalibur calcium-binding domain-containing protein [Rhodococcus globerulus]MDV6267097.1 excalibur calcium-binding domain-containing protein [Rhodococcus globerulus]